MWSRLACLKQNYLINLVSQNSYTRAQTRARRTATCRRVLCTVGNLSSRQRGSSASTGDCDDQSLHTVRDTITALSSGAGRCGVALLRVSGPQADYVLQSVLPRHKTLPEPRRAVVSQIRHPASRDVLDRALLLRFPGPNSFTGEDVAELHVHGGPAVVRAVLEALCSIQGVRLAEPGEFTRRAFELGKVDLTEAEGLADLLNAETEAQRKQALRQSTGAQRQQYESWRKTMLQCLANVEAVLDFGEDEEIAEEVAQQVLPRMQALQKQLQHHLINDRRSELVRSGVKIAIVGAPNVGKSTILNHLAGRRAAIVSAIPGTTRDAIEVILDISGYKVIVTDTAGLRDTLDPIEAEGVALAQETASQADIVVSVLDCSLLATSDMRMPASLSQLFEPAARGSAANQIVVLNKADAVSVNDVQQLQQQLTLQLGPTAILPPTIDKQLIDGGGIGLSSTPADMSIGLASSTASAPELSMDTDSDASGSDRTSELLSPQTGFNTKHNFMSTPTTTEAAAAAVGPHTKAAARATSPGTAPATANLGVDYMQQQAPSRVVLCSCKTGHNMEALTSALERAVQDVMQDGQEAEEGFAITRARHRYHVEQCTEALERYQAVPMELEIAAEELRAAAKSLGRVTGIIDTEDLLDAIFSEFCIGK